MGHTSGFTEQPPVSEISHDTTPTIIGSHHQTLPIRLYYSREINLPTLGGKMKFKIKHRGWLHDGKYLVVFHGRHRWSGKMILLVQWRLYKGVTGHEKCWFLLTWSHSFEGCSMRSWSVTPLASSEWVFATVDLSEAHVAKYFDVALDDCFVKASGDELNIQIIDAGRPVFSFVKVRALKTPHTTRTSRRRHNS